MLRKLLIIWAGIIVGILMGIVWINRSFLLEKIAKSTTTTPSPTSQVKKKNTKVVVGFLPFWLINKAQDDYSKYITQLSYFNLVIDSDGTIQKYTAPGQSDPGYHSLFSGKVDNYLANAKSNGIDLSLTVFSGNDNKINKFLEDPIKSAQNLVNEISPIMSQYGFVDLNLDIEKVAEATPETQKKYTEFVREVRKNLDKNITITIDVMPISFVKNTNLSNPKELAKIVDYVLLMDYDFHSPSSYVTGPVSPQSGAGIVSEFDTESAVYAALAAVSPSQLILAIPLYGYSWETINNSPRSAILPGSAYSINSKSVDELLSKCDACVTVFDKIDSETHTIYKDAETGIYHQVFYPDQKSTQIKIDFAKSQNLGGIGLWALGYENDIILTPLASYLR
jgi:spore germination protein YaaH